MTVQAMPPVIGNVSTIRQDGGLLPPAASMPGFTGPFVWDAHTALSIPSVNRCLQLYGGMCKQMAIDAFRGDDALPRPMLLQRPDPNRARSWFVQVSVEDYLMNGNALSLVTSRGSDGWPTSVTWLPSSWVYIAWQPWAEDSITYYMLGTKLPTQNVIHVRRGADRFYPVRGVGVVEQQLSTLDRVAMEDQYERNACSLAVPCRPSPSSRQRAR